MNRTTSFFRRALAFCILHSAFCISSASAVTITATATAVGAGEQTPITATVSGGTVTGLTLYYRAVNSATLQDTWNTSAMEGAGTTYTGFIPPLFAGAQVQWYVTDGTTPSATTTTTLAATPDYGRYHDGAVGVSQVWVLGPGYAEQANVPASISPDTVNGWKYDSGASSNLTAQAPNGSQWKASGVGIGISVRNIGSPGIDTTLGMNYPSLFFYNLPPVEMPFIRSPKLEGGVGTIDFRTRLIDTGLMKSSELTLQIAYTDEEPAEADWVDYKVYGYGTQNGSVFSRICHEVLNDYGVTYVRILRTGFNFDNEDITSGRLAVDNICITKPAANVGIIEMLKNPGYPAADQNVLMRCAVTNCVEETPAVNRRVSVKYQYQARDTYTPDPSPAAWSSAEMAYMGNTNGLDWYEGLIPTQRVGYVWYYYQVDYDGYAWTGTLENGAATESISPAYWDAGEDTHERPIAGTRFQVRPYRSRYARIAFAATAEDLTDPEMTLVGDEEWLTTVPVSGHTVISNYFLGYGYYADDAAAYEDTPRMWGENNPDALSDPTRAGFLESSFVTEVTNGLVVLNEKDYKGLYLYRFLSNDLDDAAAHTQDGDKILDRRYEYIVKKAVYQDFDDWTASPTYYESSLGGLPTLTYAENFDGNAAAAQAGEICITTPWYEDEYAPADTKTETFQDETVEDVFTRSAKPTEPNGFLRTDSRIIADRKTKKTQTDANVNRTMGLALYGQFENTSQSLPYGLEKIAFKARASIDDDNFATYLDGTAWTLPLSISATWQLTETAPSKPYFSYVFLYQPYVYDNSWYELRVTQDDSTADNSDNTPIVISLWRHMKDGTEAQVGATRTLTGYNLKTSRTMNVYVDQNGSKLRVRIHTNNGNPTTINNNTTANSALIEDSTPINLTTGGSVGFGAFDAVPKITKVIVGTGFSGANPTGTDGRIASISSSMSRWYDGGFRPDGQPRWTITSSSMTRAIPTQTLSIYAADCVSGEYNAIPGSPVSVATRTVNTLTMSDFTIDFKAWNRKFVQIRYDNGDGGVVLDDIVYSPWRAVTRYNEDSAFLGDGNNAVSYLDWTSVDQQDEWLERALALTDETMYEHWAVLEGWTARSGAFQIGALFDRTRANTNLVQGIVSPELNNGIGSCSFSYSVSGGKVVYGIERTNENDYRSWTPAAVFMNASGESGEHYAKIGENRWSSGRIRVRIYDAHDVGDLLVRNPDCGYDPAWGYTDHDARILIDNLRVKDYPEDKDDNAWNAYNLLITGDAPDGQVYNNSGKSCFFNNSPTDGVYGAEEFTDDDPYLESPPLSGVGVGEIAFQYRLVPGTATAGTDGHLIIKVAPDRDTPLADWKTITNLTVSASGTAFVKFDNDKIFDERNFVVRFYNSKEPNTPRIVIDNVLVTAPARASFEFEYVKLLPVQPLVGTNTIVEAKIMREIMNPKNIRIYCSYHKYDTNNVNEAWGEGNWFDPLTSPTIELAAIAEKVYRTPANSGIPAFAADDIVEFIVWGVHNDIHTENGDTPIKQGRETFEIPEWYRTLNFQEKRLEAMDLNVDKAEEGWSPYFWVFSCAPGTFFVNEINNWRTSSTGSSNVDRNTAEYIEFAAPDGTAIGGWTFQIVHNESPLEDITYVVPAGTKVGHGLPTGWGFFTWGDEGAAFTVDAAFPNSIDLTVRNLGVYAGILVFRPNGMIEQMVRFGTRTALVFNSEDYWIWAGRKESGYTDSLSLISPTDEETDERTAGRTVDDFEWSIKPQTPTATNGDQIFADLGGSIIVALVDPDGNEITDTDVLAWIDRYGAEQSDIDKLTMEQFNEDFLLNLDITKTCIAELKITSIQIEDGFVILNVQLTRTEDATPVGKRAINGRLKLLGRVNLAAGTFTAINGADVQNNDFGVGNAAAIEYELPANNPPAFFKAVIE